MVTFVPASRGVPPTGRARVRAALLATQDEGRLFVIVKHDPKCHGHANLRD